MRPSTLDLLRIRDGEPVDAAVRAAVERDAELRAELARLTALRHDLRALPTLRPPPTAWAQITARLDAQPLQAATTAASYWPLRAGIAACVAVAAIAFVARGPAPVLESAVPPPATVVGQSTVPQSGPLLGTPAYASLVEESARLERELDRLNRRPGVVRVGTATTVAGLRDRIDAIDTRLMYSREFGLDSAEVQDLYSRRVGLMNALVHVRYADQARYAVQTVNTDLRRSGY